ncbi:MAG TPA: hypothetical protein VL490_06800 [Mucilaginibacter sp.]|jgi:hypothetical protein|nr:hypothetical protein [Mucilaginibacter sp.]
MLFAILKIVALLCAIILPLRIKKTKFPVKAKPLADTNTEDAHYAINENGMLEEVQKHSLTDH